MRPSERVLRDVCSCVFVCCACLLCHAVFAVVMRLCVCACWGLDAWGRGAVCVRVNI
jgi:hypothetical protein